MATAYMEFTVHGPGPASVIRSCAQYSESRRECVQVVWPHRVTGLLTGNLTAHALASYALPMPWPAIALARRTCIYALIHDLYRLK